VHEHTRPALRMLECEGFEWTGMVDMFDAGPTVTCPLRDIRVVRESRKAPVADVAGKMDAPELFLVTNARTDFRACAAAVENVPGGGVRVSADVARALGVTKGDTVRYSALRPTMTRHAPAGAAVTVTEEVATARSST
jgi:arginine N-succinyltransferase